MNSNLEQSLCDLLDSAGREYAQAVHSIRTLSQEIAEGKEHEQIFDRLQQIAMNTRQTETRVAQVRDVWRQQQTPPGNRLQAVLQKQEGILRELIHSLDEAERIARSAHGRMVHTVDGAARSHQMHSAYARSVRQAAE